MNNFKLISSKIKEIRDRLNKVQYKRLLNEENIWSNESGELCYFDSIEILDKNLLLENNLKGNYIISQQDGVLGETERIVCIGKINEISCKDKTDYCIDNEDIKLKGDFIIFSYTNSLVSYDFMTDEGITQSERETWWIGKNYTEELIVISEDRYFQILKQIENTSPETIFSEIDELIYYKDA